MPDMMDYYEEVLLLRKKLAKFEKLDRLIKHGNPEHSGHYFISNELGNKDNNGLPDKIEICPAYGCDFSVVYEKTDRVIGGMGS